MQDIRGSQVSNTALMVLTGPRDYAYHRKDGIPIAPFYVLSINNLLISEIKSLDFVEYYDIIHVQRLDFILGEIYMGKR